MSIQVHISHLNKRGEGVADTPLGTITVPFTLPGEIVEVEVIETRDKKWGKLLSVQEPSPSRTTPQCQHFGTCGGCSLQHLDHQAYKAFKKSRVTDPIMAAGLDPDIVEDPILIGPHNRRRIDFLTRKFPDGMNMGFYQVNSRRRINLKKCEVVEPQIEALFPHLEQLLTELLLMGELVHIFILSADNGIDLLLAGFKRELTQAEIERLIAFAEDQKLARLSYKIKRRAHVVYEKETPRVSFAGHPMGVNPNVFLQASKVADRVLSQLVVDAIPKESRCVVDLFCGRGTLTLPIREAGYEVTGFEGDKHAIAALNELQQSGLTAEVRDLFEHPLTADELRGFDTVVMNPPRSGVRGQIHTVAEAGPSTIIYVSCNPESFATDMKELCLLGYKLEKITPVDQFTWSHHIEVVGVARKT